MKHSVCNSIFPLRLFPFRIPYRLTTSVSTRTTGSCCTICFLRFIDILKLICLFPVNLCFLLCFILHGEWGRGRTGRTQTGQTGTGGGKPLRKQGPEPPEADVTAVLSTAAATEQLPPSKATEALGPQETAVLQDENVTEVLRDTDATEVLSETGATEVLSAAGATEVLTEQEGTTVLSQEQLPPQNTAGVKPVSFRITRRVEVTHADGIGENIENKVKGE